MSTVALTVEKQARPGRRSAQLKCKSGHSRAVWGLVVRRSAWLVRINDLLGELELAMSQVDRLTREIEGQGEGETKNEALRLITGAPCLEV